MLAITLTPHRRNIDIGTNDNQAKQTKHNDDNKNHMNHDSDNTDNARLTKRITRNDEEAQYDE
jgi:hypothetical protein